MRPTPFLFLALGLTIRTDDVVATAISSLTTISRTQRRPAHGSMYLLNNMSYLRHNTVLEPAHEALLDFLSKGAQDALNSNFRTAKAAYFDANFSPLLQTLTDDAGGGKERREGGGEGEVHEVL